MSYEFMTSMARRGSHRELPRGLTPALTLLAPALRDSRGITEVGAQVGNHNPRPGDAFKVQMKTKYNIVRQLQKVAGIEDSSFRSELQTEL